MRIEIARLHESLDATIVYVTHDQVEAMTLADRIVVLRGGRDEQQGTPEDLYDRPANLFVAGFIGQPTINLLDATLRPDAISLDPGSGHAEACGRVELVENLGNEVLVHVRLAGIGRTVVTTTHRSRAPRPNRDTRVGFEPAAAHVFDADGQRVAQDAAIEAT